MRSCQGVSLLECLMYVGGCSYIAVLISSLMVSFFKNQGEALGNINHFIACHMVMQRFIEDVRALPPARSSLSVGKEGHLVVLTSPTVTIIWKAARGRIVRTKKVVEGIQHTDVVLTNGADLSVDNESGDRYVTISLPRAGARIRRFIRTYTLCN